MIEVKNVTFGYRKQRDIFNDLSFVIKEGESVGIIGRNGSGKSTLIKVMLSIIRSKIGSVYYDGVDIKRHRKEVVKDVGVVWAQRTSLWWDLTVKENIYQSAYLFDLRKDIIDKRLDYYSRQMPIDKFLNMPLRKTSYGQRILADIIAVLVREPKILFFDEAFVGLDIDIKSSIFDILKSYKTNHKDCIYIITSHNFDDITNLCDRIICLKNDSISELYLRDMQENRKTEITIESKDPFNLDALKAYDIKKINERKISVMIDGTLNNFFEDVDWDNVSDVNISDRTLDSILESDKKGEGK